MSRRALDRSRAAKPLDCGNGLLAASVDAAGGLQALVVPDREHGVLVVDTQPPFPEAARHDPVAVRAYRQALADLGAPSFGLVPEGGWDDVEPGLAGDLVPVSRLRAGVVRAEVVSAALPGRPALVQHWRLRALAPVPAWAHRLDGPARLTRAALTQLTEGGVLPVVPEVADRRRSGDAMVLTSSLTTRAVALVGHPVGRGTLALAAGEQRDVRLALGRRGGTR